MEQPDTRSRDVPQLQMFASQNAGKLKKKHLKHRVQTNNAGDRKKMEWWRISLQLASESKSQFLRVDPMSSFRTCFVWNKYHTTLLVAWHLRCGGAFWRDIKAGLGKHSLCW